MSVWLTIPSAKPAAEAQKCVDAWRAMGYSVALFRDIGSDLVDCDYILQGEYKGYAATCNRLIREVLKYDTAAEWFVCAGDDIWPDETKRADVIAAECKEHFGGPFANYGHNRPQNTFGVMQPTGDPWADAAGRMIERIAGSPWIGREFALRTYGGDGPYFAGYTHCFLDNELQDIAEALGVYWRRPDLTHTHRHWTREKRAMPHYLQDANSPAHWQKYHAIYRQRKAAGFPGHECS